jgi:hypothetical protein
LFFFFFFFFFSSHVQFPVVPAFPVQMPVSGDANSVCQRDCSLSAADVSTTPIGAIGDRSESLRTALGFLDGRVDQVRWWFGVDDYLFVVLLGFFSFFFIIEDGWIYSIFSFRSCVRLADFSCDCNMLVELPQAIGKLKALTALSFHDNKIESLPDTLGM